MLHWRRMRRTSLSALAWIGRIPSFALGSRAFLEPLSPACSAGTPSGGVDLFGCNQIFRDQLIRLEELNTSLVGLLFWLGFRRKSIPYIRRARPYGRSAWTVRRKLKYLSDSVFAFSDLPIRLLSLCGAVGILVSLLLGIVVLTARLTGAIQLPGYTPTVLTILFFGALNTLGLGIIGAYTWRAFENTKRRPGYVVLRSENIVSGGE